MSKLLILEGVDGSGKTTLAEELVRQLDAAYLHFAHVEGTAQDRISIWTKGILKAQGDARSGSVVVDRLHLSELVYGPLVRGEEGISRFDAWIMDGWLMAKGAQIIYLYHTRSETAERLDARYHGLIRSTELQQAYFKELNNTPLPSLFWMKDAEASVEDRLLQTREATPLVGESLGTVRPSIWLVGDQRELGYVYKTLRVAKLSWNVVRLTRYVEEIHCDWAGRWEEMGKPKVVTLGPEACTELFEQGVSSSCVRGSTHAVESFGDRNALPYAVEIITASRE